MGKRVYCMMRECLGERDDTGGKAQKQRQRDIALNEKRAYVVLAGVGQVGAQSINVAPSDCVSLRLRREKQRKWAPKVCDLRLVVGSFLSVSVRLVSFSRGSARFV